MEPTQQPCPAPPTFVVGIGASAGGLDSLEQFFATVPPNPGCAFVVVQHLSPEFRSYMPEILSRRTDLEVMTIIDQSPLRENVVYMLPPGKNLALRGRISYLSNQIRSGQPNKPIDSFFSSLAEDCGKNCAGVILSGTGNDGSLGIQAIAGVGGLTIAEDPRLAKFDGMPKSAVTTGKIALTLAASEMPAEIIEFIQNPARSLWGRSTRHSTPNLDYRARILQVISESYNVDFTCYKVGTINRRIEKRMRYLGTDRIDAYAQRVESSRDEARALFQDFLVGVTDFFRDQEAFRIIEETVIATIFQMISDRSDELRVWVPGCCTGEEAYSLAILFDLHADRYQRTNPCKFFATDIDDHSLMTASRGIYPSERLASVPKELLDRYFVKLDDGQYQIISSIRKKIFFTKHNALRDPPFAKVHLLSCRNLLIYFNDLGQQHFLSLAHFSLVRGGFLFLGSSESIGKLEQSFEPIDRRWKIFQKVQHSATHPDVLSRLSLDGAEQRRENKLFCASTLNRQQRTRSSLCHSGLETLLQRYVPSSLLVDTSYNVVHVFGDAGKFLQIRPGKPSLILRDMIPEDTMSAVTVCIQRALRANRLVKYTHQPVGEHSRALEITVESLSDPGRVARDDDEPYLLITFHQDQEPRVLPDPEAITATDQNSLSVIRQLENELQNTRENLQSTIEELEATNEELRSTNEELLASNEELQSTNEELHSVNEELYTVNNEFQNKIEELSQLQDDEEALVQATGLGFIFLDASYRIRRCSRSAAEAFNILPQDIGREFEHLAYNFNVNDFPELLQDVARTGQPRELQLHLRSGDPYYLKVSLTGRQRETKVYVILFARLDQIDGIKQQALRQSALFDLIPEGLALLGDNETVLETNTALQRMFGYEKEELVGFRLDNLLAKHARASQMQLLRKFRDSAPSRAHSSQKLQFESTAVHRDCREFPVALAIAKLIVGRQTHFLVAVSDLSYLRDSQKRYLKQLTRSNESLEQFAYAISHDLQAPIRHISQAAELILEALGDQHPPALSAPIAIVRTKTRLVRDMIKGLLTISKISTHDAELIHVDLAKVLEDSAQMIAAGQPHKIQFPRSCVPKVIGDPALLHQLFINLLENAFKFSSRADQPEVEITTSVHNNTCVVQIRDNGLGLGDDSPARLFHIFKRTAAARGFPGTGIGLATCKRIVEQHNGRITLENRTDRPGCLVTVELPGADDTRG